jgi:hypothetical protein
MVIIKLARRDNYKEMGQMNMISGILAGALAFSGGLGFSDIVKEDMTNQEIVSVENNVSYNHMSDVMDAEDFKDMERLMEDEIINFGQMKPHLNEVHPELTNQQLREHYKDMHGTGGSSQSNNFKGMDSMH